MAEIKKSIITSENLILRSVPAENEEDQRMILEGYALLFDSPTQFVNDYEVIDKDALKETDMDDVVLTFNHDVNIILSRTGSTDFSLELEVDEKGLKMRAIIIDTQHGKDVYKLVQRGLIKQMSFACFIGGIKQELDEKTGSTTYRIMSIRRLLDVSAVVQPAYGDTSISARSYEGIDFIVDSKSDNEIKMQKSKEALIRGLKQSKERY